MDYWLIIYGVLLGIFVAILNYGAGKLGTQQGQGRFNEIKGLFCAIVGGIFGGVLAYQGGTVNPDLIMQMFSLITVGGFGIVWLIDTLAQIVASYLQPKSSLAQGMYRRQ